MTAPLSPWRRQLGLMLLAAGLAAPLAALAVPFLGLPPGAAAAVTGALVVGAPEGLMILSAVVMGKEGVQQALGPVMKGLTGPAGPVRYFTCLVVMAVGLVVPWILYGYMPDQMPHDPALQTRIFATFDLLFAAGFVLAGSEFWAKLKRLLTWTEPQPTS